ncbi:MAG: antibiotic biosynthesis monooxygenase [Phenylobacterium sp.]|uniref:putative quinol monooxygenase n=1 Tax=Phenylobacterium sp. TaxID=1871053 RepID=UPI0025D8B5AC|nr:antibiotic biosynthesis monooxygenase [Phenylobacterium sp.]MBA4012007.1 antibiotic biosynthesis monooxygenase [Phenylobacterium sp.]
MSHPSAPLPAGTVFVVNVMHPEPGGQDAVLATIDDIVRLAATKPGFLWSTLSKSLDGKTVVNVEAIADPDNVGQFFSDPAFAEKFERLRSLCASEFHLYRAEAPILPIGA